jgi:hypothetical protein
MADHDYQFKQRVVGNKARRLQSAKERNDD